MDKKLALAFGSFDILHPGHLYYLRKASTYGRLIVVVARDSSIMKLKGRKPLMDEASRLEMVRSVRFVDKAVLGERIRRWNDVYNILLKFKPDFVVFGYDQKVDYAFLNKFLESHRLNPKVVRINAYRSNIFKSSKIKNAARKTR